MFRYYHSYRVSFEVHECVTDKISGRQAGRRHGNFFQTYDGESALSQYKYHCINTLYNKVLFRSSKRVYCYFKQPEHLQGRS